jgi:hypothetical protein
LVPRHRLKRIPAELRLAHEYCNFLHDEAVRLLAEYEGARAHFVTFKFRNRKQADELQRLSEDGGRDTIEIMRLMGLERQARRVIINQTTMAMASDCLLHVYEGLSCLERRKSVVALNLFRKPMLDSLLYLSWMLGDEDGFYAAFSSGDPSQLSTKRLGNLRHEIIEASLGRVSLCNVVNAEALIAMLYESKNAYGLYGLFQHAVHLITVQKLELQTSPENFNFIFKNPSDEDLYHSIYETIPTVLLYLTHVITGLFDRMRPMDEGAKKAHFVRTTLGHEVVKGCEAGDAVRHILTEALPAHFACANCHRSLKVTQHNAGRALLTDSFRCHGCGTINGLPFSWLF